MPHEGRMRAHCVARRPTDHYVEATPAWGVPRKIIAGMRRRDGAPNIVLRDVKLHGVAAAWRERSRCSARTEK